MHPIVKDGARHGAHRLRRHVREVWDSRGGGFYGFAATLTFLYLEATSLVGDVAGVRSFEVSTSGVVGWLVQNLVTGIMNVVWSSIWPVKWIGLFGVGLKSGALLAGAYLAFRLVHPAVRRLLQDPEEPLAAPGRVR